MMRFKEFSKKQLMALSWYKSLEFKNYEGIICDGAVRSGKTLCMSIGFISWAMESFSAQSFAICSKTIQSLKRNITTPLLSLLREMGFVCDEKISKNYVDITFGRISNRFYYFGGKDESSASLIQGITLAGILLDEVALMPRSFVEQALARCSINGSKMWFNCNPENPYHWFYREWILKAKEKNLLHLHFKMADNPSLSPKILKRYERLYTGAFYDRFVLGKWTAPTGLIYPFFSSEHQCDAPKNCKRHIVSCDYGTVNPSSFGLWGEYDGTWYRIKEYYYSSRIHKQMRTDEEHYIELKKLCDGYEIESIICDPSAASFMECIRRHREYNVIPAENNVLSGIRYVTEALKNGNIKISPCCQDSIREFSLYCWDTKSGKDAPVKEFDHAMDDIRYFVNTVLKKSDEDFFVASLSRR